MFVGEPGSGKSVLLKHTRELIDPQSAELGSKPSDQSDFVARLSSSYFAAFDNMKGVTGTVEDILCVSADGGVFTKRVLRTTNENAEINVSGPMGFTSVQSRIFQQEDLQSRTVTIRVSSSGERKDRHEVETDFLVARQEIFSTLIALAVEVLKSESESNDSEGHRYGQFVKTGNAILQVLGADGSMADFLEQIEKNSIEEDLDKHPVLQSLVRYIVIHHPRGWKKPVRPLYDELNRMVPVHDRGRSWPDGPQELRNLIFDKRELLGEMGLEAEKGGRSTLGYKLLLLLNSNAPS